MPYVYSTLSNDVNYVCYEKRDPSQLPIVRDSVLIRGEANVINEVLITPKGAVTQVTDEQLEFLKSDRLFQRHVANGYVTYDDGVKAKDIEKGIADLKKREESAPLTPDDVSENETAQPTEEFKRGAGRPRKG